LDLAAYRQKATPSYLSSGAWACSSSGDRPGDVDQVNAIAWALDPNYRQIDLAFEFGQLRPELAAPAGRRLVELPRFIVGIGRKRLGMAKSIRCWSSGQTKLVHIGRLRGSLDDLDYLVTTPAYPTPASRKVLQLDIALSDRIRRMNSGSDADRSLPILALLSARGIRHGWINVFIGNPLRPQPDGVSGRIRLLARHIDRLAAYYGRDVVISGAPRSQPELYGILESALTCRHYLYRWRANDPANPFELMVRHGADSIVTGDSISMISQLVAAGHRTLIFEWQPSGGRQAWTLGGLIRARRRMASKDTAGFCKSLFQQGLAAQLDDHSCFEALTPRPAIQDELFGRLRSFVR